MKLILTLALSATLITSGFVFAQDEPLKPLPANVKSEVSAALAGVNPTDAEAVKKAVLAAIANNPSLAPQIVALAVDVVGKALVGNPAAAAKVIPAFVAAAADAQPGQAPRIVGAAVAALPASLKTQVTPEIVRSSLAAVDGRQQQAEVLNSAYQAIGDDAAVIASLDAIAAANSIQITRTDAQGDTANGTRYFADDQLAETFFSGDQGTINQGASFGGGSGGGSGTNSGGSDGNPGAVGAQPAPAS